MRSILRFALFLAFAGIGYTLGGQFPWNLPRSDSSGNAASDAIITVAKGSAAQPTELEPSFAESLQHIRELKDSSTQVWDHSLLLEGKRPGQTELQIERLFARATREDLVAFFAGAELTGANDSLLNAAYARLAELSLDEALAIWSDQFRRTAKGVGADGLVRAWAKTDPTASERWIDGLSDATIRSEALFAFLDAVVETSPDLVARRVTEIGNGDTSVVFQTIALVSRLARQLAPETLAPLAERFLAETKKGWEYQNQLVTLLEVWGERDGAAMLAWVLAKPPGSFQDDLLPRVVEARAKSDPAAFVREIGPSLPGNEALGQMAGQAWLKWLADDDDDDEAAMAWFSTHGEHLKISQQLIWNSRNWTGKEATQVLSRIAGLPEGEIKSETSWAMLQQLSQADPKAALSYGHKLLPPGHDTDSFIADNLASLARSGDPAGALAWALANLSAGQGKKDAVRYIMTEWSNSSPILAMERAKALPENFRDDAYNGIASRWAERAPEQLIDYLAKAPDPASISTLAKQAFWSFGHNRGGAVYLPRALALPNEAIRTQAIEGLFSGWSQANLESSALALDTLERGPLRDTAVAAFVSNARWADREAAVTWSLDITDPKKRREVTMQQSRYWLNADREAATQWIEIGGKLPEEWRAELLKPSPPRL